MIIADQPADQGIGVTLPDVAELSSLLKIHPKID